MRSKNATNAGFVCFVCGVVVPPAPTTARNHCPQCFASLHVDDRIPGDRASACGGRMDAIGVEQKDGAWRILHRCRTCGKEIANRLAPDDSTETLTQLITRTNERHTR